MQDIELISTRDMIEELKKRHEHIIIGSLKLSKTDDSQDMFTFDWYGSRFSCIGICRVFEKFIKDDISCFRDDQDDDEDEDDPVPVNPSDDSDLARS